MLSTISNSGRSRAAASRRHVRACWMLIGYAISIALLFASVAGAEDLRRLPPQEDNQQALIDNLLREVQEGERVTQQARERARQPLKSEMSAEDKAYVDKRFRRAQLIQSLQIEKDRYCKSARNFEQRMRACPADAVSPDMQDMNREIYEIDHGKAAADRKFGVKRSGSSKKSKSSAPASVAPSRSTGSCMYGANGEVVYRPAGATCSNRF